ncbi:MAG: hypothetical protein ACOYL3_22335 [Desulfuromonadaceae bacterium]
MTENDKSSHIWQLARQKIPQSKHVDVVAEIEYVLQYLADYAPDLYSGNPAPIKSEQEIVQLARDLSNKTTEPQVQVRFYFLSIGIEIGNMTYGWKVPLVPQLVRIKKPKNWATTDNFLRRRAAGKLEQAFGKNLELPISSNPSVYFGQLLFTAIFFGCLLDKKWLEPFLAAIMRQDLFQYNGVLWVEMVMQSSLCIQDDADLQPEPTFFTKRFFPDNFTLILLYRLLDHKLVPATISYTTAWNCIQTYLKTLPDLSSADLPSSLNEFLKLSISRNLIMPGSMLGYATGQLKSTSLAIGPWLRCISRRAVKVVKVVKSEISEGLIKAPIAKITVPKRYNARRVEELFVKLLRLLHPKGKDLTKGGASKIIESFYVKHKHEMSPAFQLMVQWGIQLLSTRISYLEHRGKKAAVAVSTIRRYFRAINTPFLSAAEDQNLTTIDPLELELIYEQTINERQGDSMALQCLQQFHGFLEVFYGLPPIESVDLKSSSSVATNANANLITLDLYFLVLKGLGWGDEANTRWQKLRIIAWVICYRCGLRPLEVRKLRVIDLQLIGPDTFEILVRITPKSDRGKRRVPGSLRMSKEEISLVMNYFSQRCNEIDLFDNDYLLAHPGQTSGRLADEDLFNQTRILLRDITMDETLVLYHARHTFNSCLQAQFQLQGKAIFNKNDFLNLAISIENDILLRDSLEGNERWGRKDQHVQAIMVGHASPDMTNQYYNHLSDVLLGCLVQQKRDRVPITIKGMMMLSGLGQSRAGDMITDCIDHPLTTLVKNQAKKYGTKLLHPLIESAEPLRLPVVAALKVSKLPPWEEVVSKEAAKILRRGEHNWEIAYNIYEGIRRLGDKRLKTALEMIKKINTQLEKPTRRWRGPTYRSVTELLSVLSLLSELGVADNTILLIHHPRRGQPLTDQSTSLLQWQKKVTNKATWSPGEQASSAASKKSFVEVRIIRVGGKVDSAGRQPPMSRGFELVVKAVTEYLHLAQSS